MKDILATITAYREERHWTEYQLAERSGLPQSTISSWYRKGMVPTVPSLEKVCAAFGITLSQLVRPGAPVVYGGFTSNVDMKSGAPAFGTPEYTRAALASGQLARRYNLPFRSSNACAANAVDARVRRGRSQQTMDGRRAA